MDASECYGNVVRRHRLSRSLSQEQLADDAGLHRTYISLLERGQRNPSLDVILAIASALGVSASQLIGELEQERKRG